MSVTTLIARVQFKSFHYQCAECNRGLKVQPASTSGLCKPCQKRVATSPMRRSPEEERAARRALPTPGPVLATPRCDFCPKCGGLGVRERTEDLEWSGFLDQNRCLNCGARW